MSLLPHDLANIEAFHCRRPLLIGRALHFSGDWVELFARVVERGHVLRFHHQQDASHFMFKGTDSEILLR